MAGAGRTDYSGVAVQRVGAYEVLFELKSGGMGSVLLARRRGPGAFEKLVAIKTIRAELAGAQQVRAMFLDEAAILARLSHPAVATVHDFGEEGGNLYLVMEYVAGVSLYAVDDHQPPPAVAAQLVAAAARGLHAAHELRDLHGQLLGVVHRDISPDNVLITFDGRVKVIDFGIALIKGRQAPVTELGTLKGKPPYMSPEQIKNEPIDRRSDVFALGAVLWELLAGDRLFQGDSVYAIARAIEHQPIAPPSTLAPGLPAGLDEIVLTALRRDPAQRQPSAAVFAEQLERVAQRAGGDTLERWAQRVLAPQREAHQQWLAGVLGGGVARAPMGRATGAVTAMALPAVPPAVAPTPPALAAPEHEPPALHAAPEHKPPMLVVEAEPQAPLLEEPARSPRPGETTELTPRGGAGRRWAAVLVGMLALAALGSWAVLRWRPAPSHSGGSDGGADAVVVVRAPIDARAVMASDAEAPDTSDATAPNPAPDAAPPEVRDARSRPPQRDARERPGRDARPAPRDARPATPDAAVLAPPRDAAPAAGGAGSIRVLAEPYANVMIDDVPYGPTPILSRKLPAGRHELRLVDPVTGAVRLRRTIEVVAGKQLVVSLP